MGQGNTKSKEEEFEEEEDWKNEGSDKRKENCVVKLESLSYPVSLAPHIQASLQQGTDTGAVVHAKKDDDPNK